MDSDPQMQLYLISPFVSIGTTLLLISAFHVPFDFSSSTNQVILKLKRLGFYLWLYLLPNYLIMPCMPSTSITDRYVPGWSHHVSLCAQGPDHLGRKESAACPGEFFGCSTAVDGPARGGGRSAEAAGQHADPGESNSSPPIMHHTGSSSSWAFGLDVPAIYISLLALSHAMQPGGIYRPYRMQAVRESSCEGDRAQEKDLQGTFTAGSVWGVKAYQDVGHACTGLI